MQSRKWQVIKIGFSIFKKTDPICGMKQKKGQGLLDSDTNNWFCSERCKTEFGKRVKVHQKKMGAEPKGCCQ